ncbi:MAG: hypothetical protein JO113_00750 [Candidatus Eremiobacteraeota bacterium]|nr:hypothetical protein [Candidatus Eremiobacteraeota bacterium]
MAAALLVAAVYAVKDSIGGTPYQAGQPYDIYFRVLALSRAVLVCIAFLIARKPALSKSDALLFWGLCGLALDVFWQYTPPGPLFWFSAALAHAAIGFGMAQLVRYAAAAHPSPRFKRTATYFAVAIGATIAAGFANVALGFGSIGGHMLDEPAFLAIAPWLERLRWLGMLAACVAIEACAIAVLRRATESTRARALLVVASFAPLALTTSAHALTIIFGGHDVAAARDIDALGNVLTAAGLAYGALTRRLVDVEFYVSAAVAAAAAGAALTILAFLGEHFFVPWVGESVERLPVLAQHGPAVRIGAHLVTAFVAFLTLTKVYDEAGPRVRNAIFHHREQHVQALRAFGENAATLDAAHVAPALVDVVMQNVAPFFAALYRRDANRYRLAYARGDPPTTQRIALGDERIPTSLAPHAVSDGSVAFAMAAATGIAGFLIAGPKRDGTAYAPDELRALGLATREAGFALGSVSRL